MNWKQLHASAHSNEKLEGLIDLLHAVERYQRRWILAGLRLLRNRRRRVTAHFIGDRRSSHPQWRRALITATRHISIAFIIATLITGVALFSIHVEKSLGIATILAFEIALVTIMYLPRRYRFRSNTH